MDTLRDRLLLEDLWKSAPGAVEKLVTVREFPVRRS
jgi:hypothetical protein